MLLCLALPAVGVAAPNRLMPAGPNMPLRVTAAAAMAAMAALAPNRSVEENYTDFQVRGKIDSLSLSYVNRCVPIPLKVIFIKTHFCHIQQKL